VWAAGDRAEVWAAGGRAAVWAAGDRAAVRAAGDRAAPEDFIRDEGSDDNAAGTRAPHAAARADISAGS